MFEDALMQLFGLSRAGMYIDILWIAENGEEVVIRVAEEDAQKLLGAAATVTKARVSLVNEHNNLSEVIGADNAIQIIE